jgi:predicted 3-demethylubiquinone-9 3-methyltransferase (glyoxalase superfamily)
MQQKITTFLWFDNQAEDAANFYVSVFGDGKITNVHRPAPDAPPLVVTFELFGQQFMALNGGPEFRFTEAISLYVDCATQDEVDDLWAKLVAGGEESQCGWLKDRYGLSWQIIPRTLSELLSDPDPERARRAMAAMMTMQKIDSAALAAAADG